MLDRPPYFYRDEQRDHVTLGLAPQALDWARTELGGRQIIRAEVLTGGISHSNHALTMDGSTPFEVVLRRWTRPDWELDEPDYNAEREALAMAALERADIPAPRCLAIDPTGEGCGVPVLLMTRLAGTQPTAATGRSPQFATQLAAAAQAMHERTTVPTGLPEYEPWYELAGLRPPQLSRRPHVWERLFEIVAGPAPTEQAAFIHRDYHAGNTLWTGPRMSGIVDWTSASVGPIGVDLGHMRVNMVVTGWRGLADAYLRAYLERIGRGLPHQQRWDAISVVDFGSHDMYDLSELELMEDYAEEILSSM